MHCEWRLWNTIEGDATSSPFVEEAQIQVLLSWCHDLCPPHMISNVMHPWICADERRTYLTYSTIHQILINRVTRCYIKTHGDFFSYTSMCRMSCGLLSWKQIKIVLMGLRMSAFAVAKWSDDCYVGRRIFLEVCDGFIDTGISTILS